MFQVKSQGFAKEFEFEDAKRQARKQDRQRRDARKGKRDTWQEVV